MANLFQTFIHSVKNWYIPLIIGIIFILTGFYIFTVPLEAYITLAVLFSASFLVSGITEIVFAFQNRAALSGWGWYLINGIFTLLIGFYLVSNPEISILVLPLIIGLTLVFRSFQLLGVAFELKNEHVSSWTNLAWVSVLGIVFSLLIVFNPIFTGKFLVIITALAFIFIGIASVFLSLQLRKIKKFPEKANDELKGKIKALQEEMKDFQRQS